MRHLEEGFVTRKQGGFAVNMLDRPVSESPAADAIAVDIACVGCGYSLRGLSAESRCPECGKPVLDSTHDRPPPRVTRATREWAWVVLAGLALLLWIVPTQIETILSMRFGYGLGGASPRLNLPAPKIWAVPMLQRSIGYRPEALGVGGTMASLLAVASLFLITTRRTQADWYERVLSLRKLARWVPIFLTGGWLGFMMNMEYLNSDDIAIAKFTTVGIACVELPGTALLYLYMRQLALRLEMPSLARAIAWTVVASSVLFIAGSLMMAMQYYDAEVNRKHIQWQIAAATYMSACVATSIAMIGVTLRLVVALLRLAWPGRGK
jgi:hypothetical protein